MNHELDTKNTRLLEVNLLNQLEVAQEVDLFQQPFEELQAIHEYWRSMNQYSKQILTKRKWLNMANITDFTEKQFEDRLEKNVERLTKID